LASGEEEYSRKNAGPGRAPDPGAMHIGLIYLVFHWIDD
jgi:hypothetical protein